MPLFLELVFMSGNFMIHQSLEKHVKYNFSSKYHMFTRECEKYLFYSTQQNKRTMVDSKGPLAPLTASQKLLAIQFSSFIITLSFPLI